MLKRVLPVFLLAFLLLAGCSSYSEEDMTLARQEAYEEGYQTGKTEGAAEADTRYDDGYETGYDEGYQAAKEELGSYEQGYNEGYAAGKAAAPAASTASSGTSTASAGSSGTSDAGGTVYVTESGTKYHLSSCSYLSGSKISISLSTAKAQGYAPCSRCHPPT